MNPNPLLDPLLCETVEAHQRDLLETARITWVAASDWKCGGSGGCAAERLSRSRREGDREWCALLDVGHR